MKTNSYVIIPIFNEEENIPKLMLQIKELQQKFDYKFVLINDGSTDKSEKLIETHADQNNIFLFSNNRNSGLGFSVRKGIKICLEKNAELIIKVDADLQHNLLQIPDFIDKMCNSNLDLIYGDRFSGGINYKMPLLRKYGNILFTKLVRYLTNYEINDSQPGFFCMSNKVAEKLSLPGNYNITQQILIESSIHDFKFGSIDIEFNERIGGKSFINIFYPFKVLAQILFIYFLLKPLQTFGKIGIIFVSIGLFLAAYQISQYFLGLTLKPVTNVNLVSTLILSGFNFLALGIIGSMLSVNK